jgi:Zn-dependent peptidase ImmA (M78 family)
MKIHHLLNETVETYTTVDEFVDIMKDFLPLAMHHLKIDALPHIRLEKYIKDSHQPTFGKYVNEENVIHVGIENRHPLDVLRTLAHELVHFKQGTENRLDAKSGETGSPIENEAHEVAGIIMRHFGKRYPHYFTDTAITISEDWNKVNHHDKTNGLSRKAVKAYRREHPGSKLQTAVTTKPSKLKAGSKDAKRRKSFCARMSGNKGPMKKPNGKPTPKALALRRWNCESIEEMRQLIETAEQVIMQEKWSKKYKSSINCSHPKGFSQRAHCAGKKKHNESHDVMEHVCPDCGMCQTHGTLNEIKKGAKDSNGFTKCWPGHHAAGTKKGKNGGQVRNCVPNESVAEGGGAQQAAIAIAKRESGKYTKDGKRIKENFADGKHPEDKGDSKRYGVPTKASVSTLRKVAHQGGRKGQLAHWMANMKAGKAKK